MLEEIEKVEKKMKKLLLIPLILFLLTGCGQTEENNSNISFYVDESTCVEYIKYKANTYGGNLTPRLNADGTLKLNEECLDK